MSAGAFVIAKYESTELEDEILPIRVQPETLALSVAATANGQPAGDITLPLRVNVSGGTREYGVKPRKVTLRWTDPADIPDGYSGDDLQLPVMTVAAYNLYVVGATGTYLTKAVTVVSRIPERAR